MPTSTSSSERTRTAWWRAAPTHVGVWFFGIGAACTWVSNRVELAWCQDERYAVVRELLRVPEAGAEVVFLGTSRTARGLVPERFDEVVEKRTGEFLHSVNLAVFGVSREIGYHTLERWIEEHGPPRLVFAEVGLLDVTEWPHQNLPRFLDSVEAARLVRDEPFDYESQAQWGRREHEGLGRLDLLHRVGFHVRVATEALGRGPGDLLRVAVDSARNAAAGWGAWPYRVHGANVLPDAIRAAVRRSGFHHVDPESREGREGRERLLERLDELPLEHALGTWRDDDFEDPDRYRATRIYQERLSALCREHGVALAFVRIPAYAEPGLSPSHVAWREGIAPFYRPVRRLIFNLDYYQDEGHLSASGAREFTTAVAEFAIRKNLLNDSRL